MEEKKKKDSFMWNIGALGSSLIGFLILLAIFGFIMYCMDSCATKIGII